MADLTTYDGLVSTIGDWLNRSDLAAVIPSFITLAEATFNTDERFRIPDLMNRSQAFVGGQFLPVPPDFLEPVNLRLLVNQKPVSGTATVEYVTLTQMDTYRQRYSSAGQPQFYTVAADQFEFLPVPDQSYTAEMIYYARVPPLTPANQSNALSTRHPNLYLYAALSHSAPYLKDDDRVAVWASALSVGAEALRTAAERAQYGASPLKMRSRTFG
ncbi:hypothetical protein P0D88_34780 [Paraburkholderia sp. RL18-103-BIB-C]|uniref:phage adaptor protein n=1 Tax=Paraburkholderia sp. RL18-103-BIB-C TaxID=3031637 RepID=UPI0038BD8899